MCYCTIGCQHSTFNRLFSCVFLVWRHRLWKVNKSSVRTFRRFFLQFSYLWCSSIIDWIILKTYDQQFTLTTKKSLHIIFKEHYSFTTILLHHTNYANTTKTTHCRRFGFTSEAFIRTDFRCQSSVCKSLSHIASLMTGRMPRWLIENQTKLTDS